MQDNSTSQPAVSENPYMTMTNTFFPFFGDEGMWGEILQGVPGSEILTVVFNNDPGTYSFAEAPQEPAQSLLSPRFLDTLVEYATSQSTTAPTSRPVESQPTSRPQEDEPVELPPIEPNYAFAQSLEQTAQAVTTQPTTNPGPYSTQHQSNYFPASLAGIGLVALIATTAVFRNRRSRR
ncbi:MAG: hypothetical protein ABH864_05680 [archaeon]